MYNTFNVSFFLPEAYIFSSSPFESADNEVVLIDAVRVRRSTNIRTRCEQMTNESPSTPYIRFILYFKKKKKRIKHLCLIGFFNVYELSLCFKRL